MVDAVRRLRGEAIASHPAWDMIGCFLLGFSVGVGLIVALAFALAVLR